LEQFDEAGKFVRLVYCPQDDAIAGTSYETSDDCLHKVRRSNDGAVRFYDEYQWPDGIYSDEAYPQVKVFNEHGQAYCATPSRAHIGIRLGHPRVRRAGQTTRSAAPHRRKRD